MLGTTQNSVDIGIATWNIEAMKAFYMDVLGMEEVDVLEHTAPFVQRAGFARNNLKRHAFRFGDILIKLLEIDSPPPPPGETLTDSQRGFRYLTFFVEDMEAAFEHLKASGVSILSDGIVSGRPGRKLVFFSDPDGNLLELNWRDPSINYIGSKLIET